MAMSLDSVKNEIFEAEKLAERKKGSVNLIAVSKLQPKIKVKRVLDAGHRIFGENRVQEAAGKWPEWRDEFSTVSLHLLGPLQTNKVMQALEIFEVFHSLDREKLARTFAEGVQQKGSSPKFFVQVNTGEEHQKAGVGPGEVDSLIKTFRNSYELNIIGLMCIPPINEEASLHFALLKKIAERNGLTQLSMGMSGDFKAAIALGATHVRVGSAIFGERPT
jgi:pyridoxal phosphate enzyme (YggS family)